MSQKNKITDTSLNKNKFVIFLGFKNKRKVLQNIKNSCWSFSPKFKCEVRKTTALI